MNQPWNDVDAALRQLIDDIPLRAKLSKRAHRVAARFTPGEMAEGYLTAYSRAVQIAAMKQAGAGSDALPVLVPEEVPCAS
jgi:hypothetical protein